MFENFDDLYNEFFGGKKRKKDDHLDRMKKLLDKLNNFEDFGTGIENPYEKELGEPDEVTTYTEGPYTFEKRVWNLPTGQMIRVRMIGTPFDDDNKGKGVTITSLEDELALALSEERYEDAANIRDKINNKGVESTKENKSSTEDDEWNF